jgi:hypothetical protein
MLCIYIVTALLSNLVLLYFKFNTQSLQRFYKAISIVDHSGAKQLGVLFQEYNHQYIVFIFNLLENFAIGLIHPKIFNDIQIIPKLSKVYSI